MEKRQIEVGGKQYGYWVDNDGRLVGDSRGAFVRSESNPNKTPYLKPGSKQHAEVLAAISGRKG